MRTRDRPNFGKNKKLVRTTTISVALFAAAIMIFSSIPTIATPGNTTKMNVNTSENDLEIDAQISCGPVPISKVSYPTDLKSSSSLGPQQSPILQEGYTMYAAKSWTSNDELVKFETDDIEGTFESFGDYIAGSPTSGGTFGCDGVWYMGEQSSGVLYGADIETGDMWDIGGGGRQCNALAWDPIYNRLYGMHGVPTPGQDVFYEYNPETGEQTDIGTVGGSIYYTIGMAFDSEGTLWGWDVAIDTLFTIDTETGEATHVADLSLNLNFGQDGDFHRESNTLYLTAVTSSIQIGLATVDLETGDCTWLEDFPGMEQITSSCFENDCVPPEHDIAVKKILKPEKSGHAIPAMEMELLVKNTGNNTETFDAQMEIIKCEDSGQFLLEEDFSGDTFPPENWTTDYWKKGYSNYASGESPEAMVYKYDYPSGQYYDNYIQTSGFDATGWEKIKMDFRFAADLYYPQYCNFFIKWRKNETSSWKSVQPWDNPLNEQKEGDLYTIDCYGFGEELGENFSILFEFVGYYYYFNYFYLDDLVVQGCGGCAEYAELEKDITLDKGEEATIVFPGWKPSEWQNESYQDDWEAYPVHGFVILEGDQNPRNDDKWHLLELYYPWFYDIEVTEIGEPAEEERSMPARTFDVEATIKNVGQFPACCIGTDINIGQPLILDTLLTETEWPYTGWPYYWMYGPGYGSGWRDEHKQIVYYYGFWISNTNNAGGESPEARMYYYYGREDYHFYSAAFDTSEYESLQLSFLSYIQHYTGEGLYALEAGYSHDGKNWYAAWHEEPGQSQNYEVSVPIEGGSETTYIGFWIKGNNNYFRNWYIDDVKVEAVGFNLEFTDFACQGDDLEPGQSRTFYFDQWTPEFLAEEETAYEVLYVAECTIDVEVDDDPGNNIITNYFKLDYWHDSGIDRVSSPTAGRGREMGELLWDNGDTDGFNGYSILASPRRGLLDDFEVEGGTWQIDGLVALCLAGPVNEPEVIFWTDEDNEPGEAMDAVEVVEFNRENTGRSWFGYSEWEYQCEFEPYPLDEGRWWFEISQTSGSNTFVMVKLDYKLEQGWYNYDDYGFGTFQSFWGTASDMSWKLYGYSGGPPGISAYIQPGTEAIGAVAKNYGTFPELDLNCNAQIWEYITDPENGTQLYEDDVFDIDLDTPLGGEEPLDFDPFTFANEGRYGLFLDMPDEGDDVPKNNKKSWGIGVDDSDPISSHVLAPTDPDGENGWYVNDLEVTLTAYDPLVEDVSSGVAEIKYQIGDGPIETITGHTGSFVITQAHDDEDIEITYWAIDKVGNDEDTNLIMPLIDMDQTDPTIDLTYEWEGNEMTGYDIFMTATATDETSKMDRVEFFLNDGIQEIVTGPGPTYEWSFKWYGDIAIAIRTDGYDIAGNMASDIVDPIENFEFSNFEFSQDMQQTIKFFIK